MPRFVYCYSGYLGAHLQVSDQAEYKAEMILTKNFFTDIWLKGVRTIAIHSDLNDSEVI
jgi:hypothetical protein